MQCGVTNQSSVTMYETVRPIEHERVLVWSD